MSVILYKKQKWECAYDDWERLLKTAKAEELLDDPKAIWDEAWRHAFMIAISICDRNILVSAVKEDLEKELK
jgi:hypothetical protein